MTKLVYKMLAFGCALLVSGTAQASKTFPKEIISYWGLTGTLPVPGDGCTLCHKNNLGGNGTINKPFGETMQRHGTVKLDIKKLDQALREVAIQGEDSDKDSVSDYVEVRFDQTNPNDANSVVKPVEMPPPMGGAGGDDGQGGASGEGGESDGTGGTLVDAGVQGPPVFVPPPAADLPPPFEHGCALGAQRSEAPAAWLVLAGLALWRAARRPRSLRTR